MRESRQISEGLCSGIVVERQWVPPLQCELGNGLCETAPQRLRDGMGGLAAEVLEAKDAAALLDGLGNFDCEVGTQAFSGRNHFWLVRGAVGFYIPPETWPFRLTPATFNCYQWGV